MRRKIKNLIKHKILSLNHRFPAYEKNAAALLGSSPDSVKAVLTSTALPALFSVCQEGLCHNGGSCHQINLPDGAASLRCDCALHFTGRFCEKGKCFSFGIHFGLE